MARGKGGIPCLLTAGKVGPLPPFRDGGAHDGRFAPQARRTIERAIDRAIERAMDRAIERAIERATERAPGWCARNGAPGGVFEF